MQMRMEAEVTTKYSITGKLSDLMQYGIEGILKANGAAIPMTKDVNAVVHIPGGGDWSNMAVPFEDLCFTLRWTAVTEEGGSGAIADPEAHGLFDEGLST